MKIRALLVTLTALSSASAAHAAVLASYQFGVAGNETTEETGVGYAPTTVALNVTAANVTDPMGTVGIEISNAGAPAGAPFLRLDPQGTAQVSAISAATAVAANKFFQFSVTANAGYLLDMTTLTFDAARGGGGTPRGYVVRSSADGFAADLAVADLLTARPTYTPVTVNLAAPAFQGLSNLTFRIYSYSPMGGNSVDYDNIVVNGAVVAVPEPSAALLAAAGMLGLLRRRR